MKVISHRGNIKGSIPNRENRPSYIDCAIQTGYDVEVDIRYINDEFFLGHDKPDYKINKVWINDRIDNIWFHCKNLEAVNALKDINILNKSFCHSKDPYVLTSSGNIWVDNLEMSLNDNCIIPLMDISSLYKYKFSIDFKKVFAICTDYAKLCKNLFFKGYINSR